jgi:hypothetical protein
MSKEGFKCSVGFEDEYLILRKIIIVIHEEKQKS